MTREGSQWSVRARKLAPNEHDGHGLIMIDTLREGRRNLSRFLVVPVLNGQFASVTPSAGSWEVGRHPNDERLRPHC